MKFNGWLVANWRVKNKSYVSEKRNHAWKMQNGAEQLFSWNAKQGTSFRKVQRVKLSQ